MKLIIENIRCLEGPHEIKLKPITILVGENSSGKSSILAAFSAITRRVRYENDLDFNIPPFQLGNYSNIATYKGGRYGRAEYFRVGLECERDNKVKTKIIYEFRDNRGSPLLSKLKINAEGHGLSVKIDATIEEINLIVKTKVEKKELIIINETISIHRESEQIDRGVRWNHVSRLIYRHLNSLSEDKKNTKATANQFYHITDLIEEALYNLPTCQAIAPLRTEPKRTYDQAKDSFTPGGEHIPYVLAKLIGQSPKEKSKNALYSALVEFGKASGLFSEISIKRLGRNISDPFNVMISATGRPVNLMDVGYGVSQSLPIIAQAVLAADGQWTLLQQPEVHLHPKAQAAMGSFLAGICKNGDKNFIIETHSDFLIDRIRKAVSDKILKSSDVSIIYLNRNKHISEIHELELDEGGNILNPPPCYRSFFLRESLDMLSFGS